MQKDYIENVLKRLGMPMRLNGFTYIMDAVCLLNEPEWKSPKWKSLYRAIAKMNNTSATNVEKCIRTAFKVVRDNPYNYNDIDYYIGYNDTSNSNSLLMLYSRIRAEMYAMESKDNFLVTKSMIRSALLQIINGE